MGAIPDPAGPAVCIISGSPRKHSQSEKVANYIKSVLQTIPSVGDVDVIPLKENPLPLVDDSFYDPKNQKWQTLWQPYAQKLQAAAGFVFVTPEWHGMVPACLKNFLLLCTAKELGHKAGLLVAVSSGLGGAYPIDELRISGYKNSRICYMPEHIIIRHINDMLNDDVPASEVDKMLRQRIDYTCQLFMEYTKALTVVRESGKIDFNMWPNGM